MTFICALCSFTGNTIATGCLCLFIGNTCIASKRGYTPQQSHDEDTFTTFIFAMMESTNWISSSQTSSLSSSGNPLSLHE